MTTRPGQGMTISDQLARWARTTPDACAVRFEGDARTYGELDRRVTRLAAALTGRGILAGDRIAVLSPNSIEVWETFLAGARIGAVLVPVNFRLVGAEVAYVLEHSGASAVVVDRSLAGLVSEALAQADLPAPVVLVVGGTGDDGYEDAVRAAPDHAAEVAVPEDSPAFIMYTSGTTGRSKGAVLTHRNLLMHVFSQLASLGGEPGRRVDAPGTPMFHIAGVAGGLPPLLHGGTHVILRSGGFDAAEIVDLVEREGITTLGLVPAMWAQVMAVPDLAERDLSSLRVVYWGAAPASRRLIQSMIDTFTGAQVVTYFGQTECCPITCLLRGADSVAKVGSIGRPMLNVEVRVVDDEMTDVVPGEVGEIVYRSPMVMQEYWQDPTATAEAFAGGWFHSGDLVRQDEDGFYFVVDRKKDMIISGGENIYCAEVESVLGDHPGVAEVAVLGVPDPTYGETPLAIVVPQHHDDPPAAEQLDAWCRERLASYKRPRHYAARATGLPRNANGKVLKTELRADHAAGDLVARPVV